jgi:ABC-2 type transport system permease protein
MSDVGTVVWKEWREHFLRRGKPSKAVVGSLAMVVFAGILGPVAMAFLMAQFGFPLPPSWIVSMLALVGVFAMAFQAVVAAGAIIIDMLAGERERHTLETLLASPLPDRAILVGKVAAVTLFCVASALVLGVTEQVTILVLYGAAGWGYAGAILAGPLVAAAMGLLACAVGTLVGMRASSVKSGQQVLQYVLLPVYMLPGLLQPLLQFSPPGRAIVAFYMDVGPAAFVAILVAALAALDAALLWLAHSLFQRDRLLLVKR